MKNKNKERHNKYIIIYDKYIMMYIFYIKAR